MALPVVQLVATGGTIAMTGSPARPALSGADLVAAVPELAELAEVRVDQLSNVPGVNLDPPAMARALAAASGAVADGAGGAVITQGTDTIEETAATVDAYVPSIAAASGMDSRPREQDAAGLVLLALGAGHLPESMLPGLDKALAAGIPVVVCARPARGGTLERTYGFVGSETDLAERGVILAGSASPWKARIRVLVALGLGRDVRELFAKD